MLYVNPSGISPGEISYKFLVGEDSGKGLLQGFSKVGRLQV